MPIKFLVLGGRLERGGGKCRGANTGRFGNFGVFPVFYRVFGPVNGVNLIKTL